MSKSMLKLLAVEYFDVWMLWESFELKSLNVIKSFVVNTSKNTNEL